jgi:hypothetical protein
MKSYKHKDADGILGSQMDPAVLRWQNGQNTYEGTQTKTFQRSLPLPWSLMPAGKAMSGTPWLRESHKMYD